MKKNAIANSVNTPSASAPSRKRRKISTTTSSADSSDKVMPSSENICSGTSEKPVIRSKFRRMRLYSEYFDSPAARSSCSTTISVGLRANLYASAGTKVFTSPHWLTRSITLRP